MRRAQAPPPGRQCPGPPYHVSVDDVVAVVQLGQVLEVVELAEHHFLLGRICGEQGEGVSAWAGSPDTGPPTPSQDNGEGALLSRGSRVPGAGLAWGEADHQHPDGPGPPGREGGRTSGVFTLTSHLSLPILPPQSPHPWPEQKLPPSHQGLTVF